MANVTVQMEVAVSYGFVSLQLKLAQSSGASAPAPVPALPRAGLAPRAAGGSCRGVTARCFSPQLRRGDAEGDAGPGRQRGGHQGCGQRRRLGPDGESREAPRRHRRAGRVRRAAPAASPPAPVVAWPRGPGVLRPGAAAMLRSPCRVPRGSRGSGWDRRWGGRAQAPRAGSSPGRG